jgi:hypothetical protein
MTGFKLKILYQIYTKLIKIASEYEKMNFLYT